MRIVSCFGLAEEAITNKEKYNCILGISVGSRDFSKDHIKKYIDYCLKNFNKILIIVVDEIKKYNWIAIGEDEKDAETKAVYEGKEMMIAVKKILKFLKQEKKDISRIKIMTWNEIVKDTTNYISVLQILRKYYTEDAAFHDDCIRMVKKYFDKRKTKAPNLEIASNYVLMETALFMLIGQHTKEKYCIDVYPGKFLIMENIFNNKYQGLLKRLPKNILYEHIEIALD
jgi:tRNA-dependent cyclodipeptide synthase